MEPFCRSVQTLTLKMQRVKKNAPEIDQKPEKGEKYTLKKKCQIYRKFPEKMVAKNDGMWPKQIIICVPDNAPPGNCHPTGPQMLPTEKNCARQEVVENVLREDGASFSILSTSDFFGLRKIQFLE